ncbi:granulocyte colony-stimulating factor [Heliangelus exortis]|uniref:granulocyte colony-stimulating factor n=1 Tax=Heliangelus exortis TaxID=472823 RepID=UPI003A932F23
MEHDPVTLSTSSWSHHPEGPSPNSQGEGLVLPVGLMPTWAGEGVKPGRKSHCPLARSLAVTLLVTVQPVNESPPAPSQHPPGARAAPGTHHLLKGHRCPLALGKPLGQHGAGSGRSPRVPMICMLVIKTLKQSALLPHRRESPGPAINVPIDEATQSPSRRHLPRGGEEKPGTMCTLTHGLTLLLGVLLWRALDGAPLGELSGDQDFQLFLHKNLEFTRKIKGDVAVLQQVVCNTFQLCKEEELLLVRQDLGITQTSLEQCHGRTFQAEVCLSQLRDGLRAYHSSLAAILELLPEHARLVETLQLDTANLSSNIQQQMEDLGLATVTYPTKDQGPLSAFSSHFHQQVGGFFILANFQRFLETAYRALRHLAHL